MKRTRAEDHLIRETVSELNVIRKEELKLRPPKKKNKREKGEDEESRTQKNISLVIIVGIMLIYALVSPYPMVIFLLIVIGIFALIIKKMYANFKADQGKKNNPARAHDNACRRRILDNHYPKIDLIEKRLYTDFRLRKNFFIRQSFLKISSYQGQNKKGAIFSISKLVTTGDDSIKKRFGLILSLNLKEFLVKNILIQNKSLKGINRIPDNITKVALKGRNSRFLNEFDVFSQDKEEANRLLTNAFLEPLVDLVKDFKYSIKWSDDIIWSFTKNEINLLVRSKYSFFELPSRHKLFEREHIEKFISEMEEALDVIARIDLQLTKIPANLKKEFLEKKNAPTKEEEETNNSPYDHLIDNSI